MKISILFPAVALCVLQAQAVELKEESLANYNTRMQWFGKHWEGCYTMNKSWGYKKHDQNWKSPETVYNKLKDINAKGGVLLLNVGPDGNGRIGAMRTDPATPKWTIAVPADISTITLRLSWRTMGLGFALGQPESTKAAETCRSSTA